MDAVGKTLGELEAAIVAAYWPKYTTRKPSIVVRVTEHKTAQVSITGAVHAPGVYELPAHQMTLVAAIMAAGGIAYGPLVDRLIDLGVERARAAREYRN